MWVRQCELDAKGLGLPIPSRIASNEEFIPPPPTSQQEEYAARAYYLSDEAAKRLFDESNVRFAQQMMDVLRCAQDDPVERQLEQIDAFLDAHLLGGAPLIHAACDFVDDVHQPPGCIDGSE